MTTREWLAAAGAIQAALAVRSETFDNGVVTSCGKQQNLALMTETNAPVSTRPTAATPSTHSSITFVGEKRGLGLYVDDAVRFCFGNCGD